MNNKVQEVKFNINGKEITVSNYAELDGKKGIIKIKNKFFEKDEINKIALVAPMASLIVIKNYEVVEKIRTEIPNKIEGIVKCVNPKCITNSEVIRTKFDVVDKENLELRCHYCEKFTSKDTISFVE